MTTEQTLKHCMEHAQYTDACHACYDLQYGKPKAAPARRLFTATLVIGPPGSGKTSLFATFSEYLWEVYHRVLLLYSWDGGAIPNDVQKRMKQGLIRYWRARTRSAEGLALETLYLGTRGYWPRRINAETGETSPGVELVAPVTTKYVGLCAKGHQLFQVGHRALITPVFCTPCSQLVGLSDMRVQETTTRTKGFELVGGVGFDGLTSMTNEVLDHMDKERGAGQIGGEKSSFGGILTSGSIKFGGNNRADVGFGQSRGRQFVNNSLAIPNLVEGPVFTALTDETTDEGDLPVVGAKLPGHAVTGEASGWFGNVLEQGKLIDDLGKSHFCLYIRPFTDKQNRRHLLKTSGTVFGVPDKLVDPPEEEKRPFEQANLGHVFRLLDADLQRSLLETIEGAPGIPSEFMDYGEALTAEGSAAPQPVAVGPLPLTTAAGLTLPGPSIVAPVPSPPSAGPQLMVAQPRKRRGNGEPQTVPLPAVAAPAPAAPAATSSPEPVRVPAQPSPIAQAASPVGASGTVPPPPPGMKPPMKAPGA